MSLHAQDVAHTQPIDETVMASSPRDMTEPSPVLIVIACAIRLYREGLTEAINHRAPFRVVATATSGETLAAATVACTPHIALVDTALEDGLRAARWIADERPDVRVVAVGLREATDEVLRWAESGIAGLIDRNGSTADLLATLTSVLRGELLCSPKVAATLLRRVAATAAARSFAHEASLTSREREILQLVERGLSNKQIAGSLRIELATVKNHVHRILEKLRVRRRGEAAARLRWDGAAAAADAADRVHLAVPSDR